jgi:hypothetical protein
MRRDRIIRVNILAVFTVFLLFLSAILPGVATAQTLYGIAHIGPDGLSTLYTINTYSGASTPVGPIGFEKCSGLDFDPSNILYAVCERPDGKDTGVLITIDTDTGAGTEIGLTGVPAHGFGDIVTDISFRNSDSTLFAFVHSKDATEDGLLLINSSTGASTGVGPVNVTTCCGHGISFIPGGHLLHADETNLNRLNAASGAVTFLTDLDFSPPADAFPRINSMDPHPATGRLFAVVNDGSSQFQEMFLATLNINTGNVTIIGPTVDGLHAIAFTTDVRNTAIPSMNEWGLIVFMVIAFIVSAYYLRRQNNNA